jgi:catechol 2,3-dioxygenase-like lactoylglutathione lyase family enzyme
MTDAPFSVGGIDHVELVVPHPYEAAGWYEQTLGLSICEEYEYWAEEGGPLMISSDGGATKLALFEGESQTTPTPFRVAFHVDDTGFLRFIQRLAALDLSDDADQRVTSADIVDHDDAFSIYFQDPYGTRLEVTTYDYEAVSSGLDAL